MARTEQQKSDLEAIRRYGGLGARGIGGGLDLALSPVTLPATAAMGMYNIGARGINAVADTDLPQIPNSVASPLRFYNAATAAFPPAPAMPAAPAMPTAAMPPVPSMPAAPPQREPSMLEQSIGAVPKPMPVAPTERAQAPTVVNPAGAIDRGIGQQGEYAQSQQDRALEGARLAAASGNPMNATARFNAAIGALSPLAGQNNFAGVQGKGAEDINAAQTQAYAINQGAVTAANALAGQNQREYMQQDQQNIASKRSAAAHMYSADTTKEIAENTPHPFGSTSTIDPITGMVSGSTTNYGYTRTTPTGRVSELAQKTAPVAPPEEGQRGTVMKDGKPVKGTYLNGKFVPD